MSLTESSSTRMALALNNNHTNSNHHHESFHKFFECWIVEQNQHLQELISVSSRENENQLRSLINRVVDHYEHYYKVKSWWAEHDVLAMLTPSWRSSLEDAFLWIGGWRPTMAFHLLYSKSGLQLESGLAELLRGLSTGDLGDLSPGQLTGVDSLHTETVREEREITEKMAEQQETVADSSMVELSHMVTEMMRNGREAVAANGGAMEDQVKSNLGSKESGLRDVLERADDLRLRTLKGVITILNPIQAVHFLIAAAELHLRIHDWGKHRDDTNHH